MIPDPTNYKMKGNKQVNKTAVATVAPVIPLERLTSVQMRELAAMRTELSLNALETVIKNPDARDADRIAAANALLDRGHGKPSQTIINDSADSGDIRQQIHSLLAAGIASAKLLQMCKALGIDVSVYNLKLFRSEGVLIDN